jgi:hypothetical protein
MAACRAVPCFSADVLFRHVFRVGPLPLAQINTPASQGAIGDLYNFHLDPSLTLGCGSWGSTSVSTSE